MDLIYKSTRNNQETATASEAILKGLAGEGGLFVPSYIPKLDKSLKELSAMSYQEVAYEVMKLFMTDFTEEELKHCINSAYDKKFDTESIAELVKKEDAYYLELFHGATIAFKDMALSILPYLMTTSAKKNHVKNEIVILTATSGDTGKAALAGFADVPGTKIIVFYPKHGVSPIQEKQMVTQRGNNTYVIGIEGNFDDAQTGVKKMFSDAALAQEMNEAGYQFSSANSINIGRLVPQVVYYVYSYAALLARGEISEGEQINVVVPTGNFGNILAASYAKEMGIPIAKLICASNENKVLFDFFTTGCYDRNRDFILTSSPSMDILISSNLERLIYQTAGRDAEKNKVLFDFFTTGCYDRNRDFILTSSPSMDILISSNLERLIYQTAGRDAEKNREFMKELNTDGVYTITEEMKEQMKDFYGNYATEEETAQTIKEVYDKTGYIIDTHTAVAAAVYKKYEKETDDKTKTVIASTASPYKFTRSVMNAIDPSYDSKTDFELIDELEKLSGVKVPQAIEDIRSAAVLHDTVCETADMCKEVKKILKIK